MKNIVLTGFMASGKTETAKAIASLYGMEYVDTDSLVVQAEKRDINTIFAVNGEAYFRDAETEAVKAAARHTNAVIATGGGVVLRSGNIDILRKTGVIYNLAPDFSIIAERVTEAAKTRPLMKNRSMDDIRANFEKRMPFYANCDFKIEVKNGDTAEDTAKAIYNLHKEG